MLLGQLSSGGRRLRWGCTSDVRPCPSCNDVPDGGGRDMVLLRLERVRDSVASVRVDLLDLCVRQLPGGSFVLQSVVNNLEVSWAAAAFVGEYACPSARLR